MPSERWQQLEQLFAEAVALPADRREAFVDGASGVDSGVRDELTALLATVEHAGPFLSSTALDVFARQISREGWSVRPGDLIGSYAIERRLGSGGAGEVWRARDERIGRAVAIKLLLPHPGRGAGHLPTLHDEARAAGTLNHPNIVTVYDVGWHGGAPYLVTECLEGESLRARLGGGALPLDAALDIARQIAMGLAAAHRRGIVHGDLKPENVFVCGDGRVKILDFGLATLQGPVASRNADATPAVVTGTVSYMSPEQLRGESTDGRTDLFALGVVLHEMLTGRRPFEAGSIVGTIERILTGPVERLSAGDRAVPQRVSDLIDRCLTKAAAARLGSADDAVSAIESAILARQPPPARSSVRAAFRRPVVLAISLLMLVGLAAGAWQWRVAADRLDWARTVASAEARRLYDHGEYGEAYFLARRALAVSPDDPSLQRLWIDMSVLERLATEPAGVEVAIATYRTKVPVWVALGRTPLTAVRMPRGQIRMRLSKPGFETLEVASAKPRERYRLEPVGSAPPGMVRVTGGPAQDLGAAKTLDDFWIDRFEVTNEQFQAFADEGGYRRPELWREPFVDGDRVVPWAEAMARFHDRTGRPGPATWAAGRYPAGRGRFPVGGVSWYEATAYAVFMGRSLPTMHHWFRAAALDRFADILGVSNFDGHGPVAVGDRGGLGPFGTEDMAGNVKEWYSSEVGGQHGLLGGAWDDQRDVFTHFDPHGPFDRAPQFGLRLARYLRPLSPAIAGPVPLDEFRDGRTLRPAGDDVFAVIRQQYAYDRGPLNAEIEDTERTDAWTRLTLAIDGAPGSGRLRLHLFLPRRGSPPYQAIVFFPSADAFQLRSSRDLSLGQAAFIIRRGRALLYPVYDGTYERATDDELTAIGRRAQRIAWSRQLGRAIDYLESRPDIDATRLGFYGISAGADAGTILTALEPRLKASVLQGTGIWGDETPENNAVDYAPRIRVPTLMLNGRYDFGAPPDTAQRPLFDLLGTPPGSKRHVILDTGHAIPIDDAARELLPWFDRYLGPVALTPGS
jgi:formylglycine-generating enzyme required for sulfatase activity/dienelactone hydrolase